MVLCVSFYRTDSGLCIYQLVVSSIFNFLYHSLWITLPNQSCLLSHYFCANLLHSLIIVINRFVSITTFPTPPFFFFLHILVFIWLVLMALFCAAIRRDSVSLVRFSFPFHGHVFSFEMSLASRLKRPECHFPFHLSFLVVVVLLILVL